MASHFKVEGQSKVKGYYIALNLTYSYFLKYIFFPTVLHFKCSKVPKQKKLPVQLNWVERNDKGCFDHLPIFCSIPAYLLESPTWLSCIFETISATVKSVCVLPPHINLLRTSAAIFTAWMQESFVAQRSRPTKELQNFHEFLLKIFQSCHFGLIDIIQSTVIFTLVILSPILVLCITICI